MIHLGKIPTEPYWIDLGNGLRLKVKPPETALYRAADAAALRQIAVMREAFDEAKASGTPDPAAFDFDDAATRTGLIAALRASILARYAILEWQGVGDEAGEPVPVTPDNVAALMRIEFVAAEFLVKYLKPVSQSVAEGNA